MINRIRESDTQRTHDTMKPETTDLILYAFTFLAYAPLFVCAIWAIILGMKGGDE